MPRGAGPRREREYEQLKARFAREGRYPGREEEVAARIVNKQRAQYRETAAARRERRTGTGPDRGLPIRDYEQLTIAEAAPQLDRLAPRELRQVRRYESAHKNRRGILQRIDRRLGA